MIGWCIRCMLWVETATGFCPVCGATTAEDNLARQSRAEGTSPEEQIVDNIMDMIADGVAPETIRRCIVGTIRAQAELARRDERDRISAGIPAIPTVG